MITAIDVYIQQHKDVEKRITTVQAEKLFIRSKGQDGASSRYMHQLSSDVRRFAASCSTIDSRLRRVGGSPRTRYTIDI